MFIPRCFILLDTIVNGIAFLISQFFNFKVYFICFQYSCSFLWLLWCIFSHHFKGFLASFNLGVSLNRQHINKLNLAFLSGVILCLFTGVFRPFIFNSSIDTVGFTFCHFAICFLCIFLLFLCSLTAFFCSKYSVYNLKCSVDLLTFFKL